jgi:transposase
MGKANFTEDFKRDAVVQISDRGYPVAEVAARLGVSKYSLYEWRRRYAQPAAARDDDPRPFSGPPEAGVSGHLHGGGLGAPPGFCSEIGGLWPMAPCGRSSL